MPRYPNLPINVIKLNNYSDKRVLCSTPQTCLANVCTKTEFEKDIELRNIKNMS